MDDNRIGSNSTLQPRADSSGEAPSISDAATLGGGAEQILGRIDRYELIRELGGGGFGRVFLARDAVAGIEVAVKGLPGEVAHNPEELERVRANFALVVKLHHPHIAALLHLHRADKVWYANDAVKRALRVLGEDYLLVMEYAPGVTLGQWRKQFKGGKVPVEQALAVCAQVADALDYAHERKIVHRDVKPANIMAETDEHGRTTCRVLDFGLAAEIRSSMSRVSKEIMGGQSGTRPYMAPEQWKGMRADGRTDQYALAAMFHELVGGEVPFAGAFETNDPVIMMNAVATVHPEALEELTDAQNSALLRALSKERKDRFGKCGEFVAALAGNLVGWNGVGTTPFRENCNSSEEGISSPKTESVSGEREPTIGTLKILDLDGSTKLELAWIPPGEFLMGSPGTENERQEDEGPQHAVRFVNGFWMGTTPVTQGQWEAVMGNNPSHFKRGKFLGVWGGKTQPDLPLETVSWNDAKEFCQKAELRLPSEAEWEYAARAGTTTPFHYGDNLDATKANFSGNDLFALGGKREFRMRTTPVKSFRPNAWGLYDMHGNVWEWCEDWYHDNYNGAPPDGSPWLSPAGTTRVLRGGSWNYFGRYCRSACRNRNHPVFACNFYGFRVVLSRASP